MSEAVNGFKIKEILFIIIIIITILGYLHGQPNHHVASKH